MSAQPEQWRVSTYEGVFETDLETLKQWILEGAVLPTDKVSKGSLNWIDAGRVPKLRGAFNGEVETLQPADVETSSENGGWQTPPAETQPPSTVDKTVDASPSNVTHVTSSSYREGLAKVCYNHPGMAPKYVCRMCAEVFCDECPRLIGTSKIPVCPLCGDLCKSYSEVTTRTARSEFQGSGFGMRDFVTALGYPFQHKAALIGGALLYGFLLLAGFRGSLIAWILMFGCISHVIGQVAWGRLDRNFMPDFSAFSMLEDVVQPILLGVAITIVSCGPTIVLVICLILGVVGTRGVSPQSPHATVASAQQGLTGDDIATLTDPNADPQKLEEASKSLDESRPGAQIAREAERSKSKENDPAGTLRQLMPFLGAGILILILLLISLVWLVFYYPMALAVAGYTQSFLSVINPLVGLDTIRRMRSTYFKAFGMVSLIQFTGLMLSGIVAFLLSPFALPFVGNLPANFISATLMFYFNLVIACVLGLSLYKCADRLGINVD